MLYDATTIRKKKIARLGYAGKKAQPVHMRRVSYGEIRRWWQTDSHGDFTPGRVVGYANRHIIPKNF